MKCNLITFSVIAISLFLILLLGNIITIGNKLSEASTWLGMRILYFDFGHGGLFPIMVNSKVMEGTCIFHT